MPTAQQICLGLQSVAEDFQWLAIIQHILVLSMALVVWLLRNRVGRLVSLYVALTLGLVSFLAFSHTQNLFTGIVFAVLALIGLWEVFSSRMDYSLKGTLKIQIIIAVLAGFLGFWYPHFVENKALALIASPYGLIPCPTLTVILALFILVYPYTNKLWHWSLTLVALYYSLTGVLRLKVNIDLVLLVVAIYSLYALIVLAVKRRPLGKPAV